MSRLDLSDPATIAALTDALTVAGVGGLEISNTGGYLRIVVAADKNVQVNAGPVRTAYTHVAVKAPMAGHFSPSHPSTTDLKDVPRMVFGSEVVGFIRIGPVLLPVTAGRSGLLTKQLAQNDVLVGFGDPLFEIEPAS